MIKGSLIDLLFQKGQPPHTNKQYSQVIHSQGKARKQNAQEYPSHSQTSNKSNKVIKITQFNSSLIIGEDKMLQSGLSQCISQSPQKNFNIKKVNQFKNKVMVSAQRTVELQLKKKEQDPVSHPKPISLKCNTALTKKSIDKVLITTKCNMSNEMPSISDLYQGDNLDQVFYRKDSSSSSKRMRDLSQILKMQRMDLHLSKDILAQTNQSLKEQIGKEEPKLYLECPVQEEFQPEEIQSPLVRRLGSPRKIYSRHIMEQKKYQQNLEKEKREILELKKELNKNYSRPFNPPQNISAQAYIIYETDIKKIQYNRKLSIRRQNPEAVAAEQQRKMLLHSHKVVASVNPRVSVEMASLTKIMTCIVTLEIAKKFCVNVKQEEVTIGLFEENIGGTSAHIKKGEIYTIWQLLFGLMLPSGNDASLALAVWGGRKLMEYEAAAKTRLGSSSHQTRPDITSNLIPKRDAFCRFIQEMNNKAGQLCMQKTRYANSHGLANIQNKSCPFDLSILCQYAMNNAKFREIVSTRLFESEIRISQEESQLKINQSEKNISQGKFFMQKRDSLFDPSDGLMEIQELKDAEEEEGREDYCEEEEPLPIQSSNNAKIIRWQNSHLLLQSKPDLYVGIKTGITVNAGPCLASCVEFKGRRFIIIVLNCKSMKYRFKDTQNLRKWLFNKEGLKYSEKGEAKCKE